MASGSEDFTKSTGTSGRVRLHVAWSQSGNSTTFNWTLYIQCTDPSTVIFSPGISYDVDAEGGGKSGKFTWPSGGGERKIDSGSVTKTHGSDGRLGSQSFSATMSSTGTQGLGGPATASGSITPPRIPVTPSTPRSVSIGSIDRRSARVSFTAPSDNGGASIDQYRTRVSKSSSMSSASTVTGSSPVTLTGLDPNTDYWVDVQAHNSVGWGDRSSPVKFTTRPAGMKRWTGSSWVDATVKRWNGSSWVEVSNVKRWTGSSWVDAG